MGRKPKAITLAVDEARIAGDLRKYQEKAIELGATRAKIVHTDEIPVDERVTMKCQIPLCFGYGVSANCPPNTIKPAELRTLLEKYQWAVFFVKEIPSEVVVRDKATIKERVAAYQDVYKMVISAGWSIYPIGSDAKPDEIPCGVLAGIIIVR